MKACIIGDSDTMNRWIKKDDNGQLAACSIYNNTFNDATKLEQSDVESITRAVGTSLNFVSVELYNDDGTEVNRS